MPKMPKEDNANFCHIKIGSMESSWPGGNALKAMLSPAVIGTGKILLWMVAKSCTTLDGWNPIEEWEKPPSTGAGFRDHPQ